VKLREAASTIFALTAILPLLVFVYFMWRFDLLGSVEAQIGIFFALAIALLGFALFRRLTQRVADLGRALGQALTVPGAGKKAAAAAVVPVARASSGATAAVPGLGQVNEIGEIAQAFGRMLIELRASTERLEDLVFKLGALNDMVEMAARIPRIEDLLSHVLERTMRAVSAGIGSIMLLDRDRQLLLHLIHRAAEQIRDPRVHLDRLGARAQHELARFLLVPHVIERARLVIVGIALDVERVVDDAVQTVDAGFDRHPRQQLDEPARRDADPLRRCLRGVRELPRGGFANGSMMPNVMFDGS